MNQLLLVLDRGRARLRRHVVGAAAALLASLVVLGGWRMSHRPGFGCKPPPGRLAAAWPLEGGTGSRRDLVERTLLASGRSDAAAVWQQLSSSLDAQVTKWAATYQETCEATHARGEQSTEVLDLRMRCLSQNLDEIRALTDVLITADAHAVGQAVSAAGSLAPVTTCSDVAWLRSKVPLPRDDIARRKVEALQRALNDARALIDLGYAQAALEKTRALQPDVETMHYPPLTAQLQLLGATVKTDLGDFSGAESAAKDAFIAAETGKDDALRAKVASVLIMAVGMQGRREESDLWVREANAILDRLGEGHARTRSWVLTDQGAILNANGEFERARQVIEQSIALKEQLLGPHHPDVAISLLNLGVSHQGMGRLEQALAAEDRALAIWKGQGNLLAAKTENNRGEILAALGRRAEAEHAFQRALLLFEHETDPDTLEWSWPLTGLGELKLAGGDASAAIPLFERALRIRERQGKLPTLIAETRFGLARALWTKNATRARALALARSARTAYADGRHAAEVAKLDAWLAAHVRRR